ncbi:hypothetical protein [Parerythrobacter aestuarii]|uniref:hypothetical protein n=1 Tax=Parerythrobacter aestuarii TaxID=3020909 RepID=UPI0024DE4215|nr:hypothetical protein [Parerythrobacter aestuarii]
MVAFRFARLALLSFALALVSQPASAQSLSPELKALEEQLPGRLVNDPSRIDWDSYGPEFHAESIVDESIPGGGAARRFHVKQASEFIYAAGTNIPLIRNVKRGDTVTIGFYARTLESSESSGKGILRVRFQKDAAPYPGFGEQTLEIGTEWDWYEVTASAEQGLDRKNGIVAIQFGRTRQVLEIGQAIVITGASSIIGRTAPQPEPAVAPLAAPELPKPLQGLGTLINDPTDRDWGFAATEGVVGVEEYDDSTIWLGKTTRLSTVPSTDETAGVDALVSLNHPVGKGDEILVALAAKTVTSPTGDGKATLGVRFFAPAAGETFGEAVVGVGDAWQLVRFVTKADRNMTAREAMVGLRITGGTQAIDVGPVYVLRTGTSVE